jgi:hypothetical protein
MVLNHFKPSHQMLQRGGWEVSQTGAAESWCTNQSGGIFIPTQVGVMFQPGASLKQ